MDVGSISINYEAMLREARCRIAELTETCEHLKDENQQHIQKNAELSYRNIELEAENEALRFCIERFTAK